MVLLCLDRFIRNAEEGMVLVKKLEKAQQRYADYIEDVRASMRADPQPVTMYRRAPLITR